MASVPKRILLRAVFLFLRNGYRTARYKTGRVLFPNWPGKGIWHGSKGVAVPLRFREERDGKLYFFPFRFCFRLVLY